MATIKAGAGNAVQDFGFGYDVIGNLTSRSDANTGLSETFTYDSLNRLRTATVGLDIAKSVTYDSIGNITSKSDVGTYSYPAPGQPFPHALSSVAGSVINATFAEAHPRAAKPTRGTPMATRPAATAWPSPMPRSTSRPPSPAAPPASASPTIPSTSATVRSRPARRCSI